MADIFLSYAEEDRETARRVALLLESAGWSVWWDRRIPAGKTWRQVIDTALREMACMVVLWSRHSIVSTWVSEEAEEGRSHGRLVPVLIEKVLPPLGFRSIQAADLSDWDRSPEAGGFRQLVSDLQSLIGKPQPPPVIESVAGQPPVPARTRVADATDRFEGDRSSQDTPLISSEAPAHPRRGRLAYWLAGAGSLATVGLVALFLLNDRSDRLPPSAPGPPVDTSAPAPSATAPPPLTQGTSEEPARAPAPEPMATVKTVPQDNPPAGAPSPKTPAPRPEGPPPARPAQVVKNPPLKYAAPPRAMPARCAEVLEQAQLGELSPEDRTFLQQECKR